jgi:flagellar hook-associated protein 2
MSSLRIGGLASGMDIDQIVGDLMKAERMPLDKLKQKRQILEWRRDDYRSLNTLLLDFRKEITKMKQSSAYRVRTTTSTEETRVSAYAKSTADKSSYTISSVQQLASAETVKNGSPIANSDFDQSGPLYRQSFSSSIDAWKNGVIENKTLIAGSNSSQVDISITGYNTGAIPTDDATLKTWSVKVNGKSFEVVGPTDPLNENQVRFNITSGKLEFGKEIVQGSTISVGYVANTKTETLQLSTDTKTWQLSHGAINDITNNQIILQKSSGSETLIVEGNTGDLTRNISRSGAIVGVLDTTTGTIEFNDTLTNSTEPISLEVNYDQKYTNFSISSFKTAGEKTVENFLIQGNESLNQMINKVNSSTTGVSMFYDEYTKQMTLTRTETGDYNTAGREIETSGTFINDVLNFGSGAVTTKGTNAEFTINGLLTQRTTNTFEMNGVTFTLKQTFNNDTDPTKNTATPVSINVNNDTTKVFENIKSFIEKYNELIDKFQNKVSETFYKDYQPLTDEQRETLSEKQQEQWEDKSKSGLLRRDPILTGALSQMRMDFYARVDNDSVNPMYNQLATIGITTSSNYLEGGKLSVNEAKLMKAIEEDPMSVEQLFNASGSTDSQMGIAQRLFNSVSETMDKFKTKSGSDFSTNQQFAIGKELLNVDKQINRFEDRLIRIEDRYWRQFTAMEKVIQRANSQSTYLMQQFSV